MQNYRVYTPQPEENEYYPQQQMPDPSYGQAQQPAYWPASQQNNYMPQENFSAELPVKKGSRIVRVLSVMAVLLLLSAGVLGYLFWQKNQIGPSSQVAGASTEMKVDEAVLLVGKHIVLPSEQPVLLTIKNRAEINQNLEFFKEALNGDIVLIYKNTSKAYIFRPSKDILINVANIRIDSSASAPVSQPSN